MVNYLTWTLQEIITEFRGITGRPDVSMLSDEKCAQYINFYYQYVLPKELKISWGYSFFSFFTSEGVDQYTCPIGWMTVNPGGWVDGFPLTWYTDPDIFYQDYRSQTTKESVGTGDGSTNSFTFTVSNVPVLRRSLYVSTLDSSSNQLLAQDDGSGGFSTTSGSPLVGSINYESGLISGLEFSAIPGSSEDVIATFEGYEPNRPKAILFFKQLPLSDSTTTSIANTDMFVLRPVPDQVYQIKLQGIQVPSPLINSTDVPFRMDLGPLIALGAALHLFKLYNQTEQYQQAMPEYLRYKDICMQDTYEEMLYSRAVPTF